MRANTPHKSVKAKWPPFIEGQPLTPLLIVGGIALYSSKNIHMFFKIIIIIILIGVEGFCMKF
jgi:hypothetical protein